ncbi:hypothetical protein RFI_30413, partial [Reticulomyxa filosa]
EQLYDLFICFLEKKYKYLIIVGFCFDAGKQTDGNNDNNLDNKDETTPPPQVLLSKNQIQDWKLREVISRENRSGEMHWRDHQFGVGHNGTVWGKKYFETNIGRGHFTRKGPISQVVIPLMNTLDPKISNTTFQLKPFKSNDRIIFVNGGATVVIKYIGHPPFSNGEVIGIELGLFF